MRLIATRLDRPVSICHIGNHLDASLYDSDRSKTLRRVPLQSRLDNAGTIDIGLPRFHLCCDRLNVAQYAFLVALYFSLDRHHGIN